MSHFVKHRDELRVYAIDFSPDLGQATISSVALLEIRNAAGEDKTAEFRSGVAAPTTENDAAVHFILRKAATSSEQVPGTYRVKCRVATSSSEEPIALVAQGKLVPLYVVGD